ncbi:MAG TPA: hypothetical protein VKP69_12200 [Isosphaeraceae bacterium]|nr:hypothetical protein [Isosphaeraceae bacterium]
MSSHDGSASGCAKTVYWVWTRRTIEGRPALDLLRERQARGRAETTRSLHKTRAA